MKNMFRFHASDFINLSFLSPFLSRGGRGIMKFHEILRLEEMQRARKGREDLSDEMLGSFRRGIFDPVDS